ncbi:two component transcriptional regulator, LuxR family [Methylobacterium sp. 4-46]|uniref:response regulator n=1 Tax=unclassified Methylobacterium TaxID=2615210 RepID=UPI000152DDCD|nr:MULTISPECIES: response regulator transcription factor [Methylobacterium]ACA21026.1 two component transcriptional regulator, LuxR family [Methylobacterium sp. 4-46]WFT80176.1 response regulator transcription factor [Methylobacterium nodulans]
MSGILVIDDHPIVLQGCRRLLEDGGAEVRVAACLAQGYRAVLRHRPAVALVDLAFAGAPLAGLALLRRVAGRRLPTRCLVFSMHADPAVIAQALESGALGYVLKDAPAAELLRAVDRVRAGRPYLDPSLAAEVALLRRDPARSPLQQLSPRERRILALLAEGRTRAAIAADLSVSYKTVTNACAALRRRFDLGSHTELTHLAVRHARDLGEV